MQRKARWRTPGIWERIGVDDRLLLILMGMLVGVSSGLAALALNRSLEALFEWLHPWRAYGWSFLLPAAGAALAVLFLEKVVREGAGHGVPEVIYSVSRYGGRLKFRSSYSRLVASCLTIGSGGSAGPESPVVMSGAAIGANIAGLFSLNDRQRVTLVGCGAAGAISSIFNAPIAGMVFTIEVILGEWSARHIVPIAIASVAGTEVSRLLSGNQIAFSHRQFAIDTADIVASAGLALTAALASVLLTRLLRQTHAAAQKTPLPTWLKAACGGAAVGTIGLFYPMVLGEGYHFIRGTIEGAFPPGLALVALAMLAKILATSLTIGSGGSGGIFAPCLVIGSFLGLTFHRALVILWPTVAWADEGCFALLGMAGLISGIMQAPLTSIFLIVEITGGYEVILPLIVVSAVSTTLCHYFEPASFYLRSLVEKGHLLRPGTDRRVLTDLSVRELLEKDCIKVHQHMLLREFVRIVKQSHRNYFPVEDKETGRFLGMIHLDDIRPFLFNPGMYDVVVLEQIMDTRVSVADLDADLAEILRQMDQEKLFSMPVVAEDQFVGMISKATILDKYRRELIVQTAGG